MQRAWRVVCRSMLWLHSGGGVLFCRRLCDCVESMYERASQQLLSDFALHTTRGEVSRHATCATPYVHVRVCLFLFSCFLLRYAPSLSLHSRYVKTHVVLLLRCNVFLSFLSPSFFAIVVCRADLTLQRMRVQRFHSILTYCHRRLLKGIKNDSQEHRTPA